MPFIALRNMAFYTAKCHVCGCKKPPGQSVRTAFGGVKYGLLCELTSRIEVKNAMLFAHFSAYLLYHIECQCFMFAHDFLRYLRTAGDIFTARPLSVFREFQKESLLLFCVNY